MSKVYEFLKECGAFFVGTVDRAGQPQMRPFGAIMEYDGALYVSTGEGKAVYTQMRENSVVQLLALKPGTRVWVRVNGRAAEIQDAEIKRLMLEACPALKKHFPVPEAKGFAVFRIDWHAAELHTDRGIEEIDKA